MGAYKNQMIRDGIGGQEGGCPVPVCIGCNEPTLESFYGLNVHDGCIPEAITKMEMAVRNFHFDCEHEEREVA